MLEVTPIETPQFNLLSYIIRDAAAGACIVVDPPKEIGACLSNGTKVQAVINTHIHFDHTLGNPYFRGKTPILAHRADRKILYCVANALFTTLFSGRIPPRIAFTLSHGDVITLGEEKLTVIHTPGHSPGSICLYWPDNLISGDTIFAGGIGRTDIPLGDSAALKESIKQLMELPDDTLIWPGHNYGMKYPVTMKINRRALVWAMDSM